MSTLKKRPSLLNSANLAACCSESEEKVPSSTSALKNTPSGAEESRIKDFYLGLPVENLAK
jgi:hypothetical protein